MKICSQCLTNCITCCLFFTMLCVFNIVSAQSNFVSLGSSTAAQQGNISITLGQASYVNSKSSSGSMEFGIQQPYQFVAITAVSNEPSLLDIAIFPNPVHESLQIKNLSKLIQKGKLNIQILTASGQSVIAESIKDFQNKYDVSRLKAGTYFINILQQQKIIKSFKFIKL